MDHHESLWNSQNRISAVRLYPYRDTGNPLTSTQVPLPNLWFFAVWPFEDHGVILAKGNAFQGAIIMQLLFRREQSTGRIGRVQFKLWSKIELEGDENEIVSHYAFDQAVLIHGFQPQPDLMRKSALVGAGAGAIAVALLFSSFGFSGSFVAAIFAGGAAGYLYYDKNRETIFVRDLLHGRHFNCSSVIDLARMEARLNIITGFLRQVMESARHWDGTEAMPIPVLSKEDAKQLVIQGL
jgi:hypothetical protein